MVAVFIEGWYLTNQDTYFYLFWVRLLKHTLLWGPQDHPVTLRVTWSRRLRSTWPHLQRTDMSVPSGLAFYIKGLFQLIRFTVLTTHRAIDARWNTTFKVDQLRNITVLKAHSELDRRVIPQCADAFWRHAELTQRDGLSAAGGVHIELYPPPEPHSDCQAQSRTQRN